MKHLYEIADDKIFGANISGFIESEKGLGSAVRSVIECFRLSDIPFVLNNFIDKNSLNNLNLKSFNDFSERNPFLFNLINISPNTFQNFIIEKAKSYFNGHYNIAYWNWELSEFPRRFHHLFDYVDEIWVPSSFTLNAVSFASPVPVVCVPYSCGISLNNNDDQKKKIREDFGFSLKDYIYLFIFDFHSIAERKNPVGLIKAFQEAFSIKDNAFLVIKCSHASKDRAILDEMKHISEKYRIKIIDSVLSCDEISSIIDMADCYVSLHRSEGFGLTMAEAMAKGKPVIATGYSGNMDFMTLSNSYPVKYNLIEIEHGYGCYGQGNLWADPDVNDAARLMRYVYEHRDEALRVGLTAMDDIKKYLSHSTIGELIAKRFNIIINNRRLKNFIQTDNSKYIFNQEKVVYNDDRILLNDIYNSYEWKLIVVYHRLMSYLLPYGSKRRRMVKSIFKRFLKLYKKY
jgi:glycosyltransferase involved in cell wall biosynthesis